MSAKPKIRYAHTAQLDLDEIAVWNQKRYWSEHAARYVDYLQSQIEEHCHDDQKSHVVASHPGLLYVMIRRKKSGHGHIAIFQRDDQRINVLHVFHSAQNWQHHLIDEAALE